jgi:hypothetical protein
MVFLKILIFYIAKNYVYIKEKYCISYILVFLFENSETLRKPLKYIYLNSIKI